jgi:hypothetical protein
LIGNSIAGPLIGLSAELLSVVYFVLAAAPAAHAD